MLHSKKAQQLKIVVLGGSQVGKTCFIDMFLQGKHFIRHPTFDTILSRTIHHANSDWDLSFMDVDLSDFQSPSYRELVDGYLASADGIVLLYDVTQPSTFDGIIAEPYLYAWHCRNIVFTKDRNTDRLVGANKRFGCVLVGNKSDLVDDYGFGIGDGEEGKRQVPRETAEQWAASQGFQHFDISSDERSQVEDVVRALVDSIKRARRMDARDAGNNKSRSRKEDAGSVMGLVKRVIK